MSERPARVPAPHDPELFDELMQIELRRQPVNRFAVAALVSGLLGGFLAPVFGVIALVQIRKRRQRGRNLAICGLVAFAAWATVVTVQAVTGTAWWQQPRQLGRLPAGEASGLDLAVQDCFWAPGTSGEAIVLRRSCTEPHSGEAFEVLPLGDGPYPEVLGMYQSSLKRCQDDSPSAGRAEVRIQVMTPTSFSWNDGKHHAVCYFHFGEDVTRPARELPR